MSRKICVAMSDEFLTLYARTKLPYNNVKVSEMLLRLSSSDQNAVEIIVKLMQVNTINSRE
jgi:hypothetical protein